MEEDINILEPQIKACKECESKSCEQCLSDRQKVQAIQNLIARNKELEKQNKKIKEINFRMAYNTITNEESKRVNYISKSKIKEKIEELEKDIEIYSNYEEDWAKIKVLQELLEENKNDR